MILTIIGGVLVAALFIGLVWWSMTHSDEPFLLLARWIVTFMMIGTMLKMAVPMLSQGQAGAIAGVLIIAACGVVTGLTWASNWAGLLLKPLTGILDGGDDRIEASALYSVAESKRKKGQTSEALLDIAQQLTKFPEDFRGLLLMAEIQARDLKDFTAAEATVNRICAAHNKSPSQVSSALIALADWYIADEQVSAARQQLEKILATFPNTSFANLAAQRISHLEHAEHTMNERTRLISVPNERVPLNVAEQQMTESLANDSSALAGHYVAHLQQHPLDTETRQKLAMLYAEQYQRIDLAQLEFEQLIAQPHQTAKQIAQHLNLLANAQVKAGQGDAAKQTLKRIVDMFPKTALADAAQMRVATLGSELRGQQKSQASVKLGSYKKDIGLNRGY